MVFSYNNIAIRIYFNDNIDASKHLKLQYEYFFSKINWNDETLWLIVNDYILPKVQCKKIPYGFSLLLNLISSQTIIFAQQAESNFNSSIGINRENVIRDIRNVGWTCLCCCNNVTKIEKLFAK